MTRNYLNDYLFRASIVYHIQGANEICLHSQQLKLQCTEYYYNKIKMVIAPPVMTKEEHSKHSPLPFEIISKMKIQQERISILWQLTSLSLYGGMKYINMN